MYGLLGRCNNALQCYTIQTLASTYIGASGGTVLAPNFEHEKAHQAPGRRLSHFSSIASLRHTHFESVNMHSSFFNYNLTRPYPYRWFTPVALVGAIILIVLLSVMNFVQNSYTLTVQYVENPNSTVANGIWYSHWPSYLTSSVKPTCQPANLPVNTQFFTNQTGLMWTLASIFKDDDDSAASPSLPYMNNVLEDCELNDIQMLLGDSPLVQTAQEMARIITTTDIQVRAFVTCGIRGPMGYTKFNATALYDTISPNAVAGTTSFVASDRTNKASMYWAEALLSAYWLQAEAMIGGGVFSEWSPFQQRGLVILYPSKSQHDISSLEFFNITYTYMVSKGAHPTELTLQSEPIGSVGHYLRRGHFKDQILQPIDSLAKSMYSAVLTDLGQTQVSTLSNIVANATTLQYFSQNISEAQFLSDTLSLPQVESQDYDTIQSSARPTGPLGLTPSVVSTKYLCQVPRRKPLGDIFIAVLLADLVLLQAAWKLYTFGVDQVMTRMQPSAKYCEGCVEEEEKMGGVASKSITWPQQHLKSGTPTPAVTIVRRDVGQLSRAETWRKTYTSLEHGGRTTKMVL